jgi:hypothetical protein
MTDSYTQQEQLYAQARQAREASLERIKTLLGKLYQESLVTQSRTPLGNAVFGEAKKPQEQVQITGWDGKTHQVSRAAGSVYSEIMNELTTGPLAQWKTGILKQLKNYSPFDVTGNNPSVSNLSTAISVEVKNQDDALIRKETANLEKLKTGMETSGEYVFVPNGQARGGSTTYKEVALADVPVGTQMFSKNADGTYGAIGTMDATTKTKLDTAKASGTPVTSSTLSSIVGTEQGNIYMGNGLADIPASSWNATWGTLDKQTQDKYISLFRKTGAISGAATINQVVAAWAQLGQMASSIAQSGVKMDPFAILQDIAKNGNGSGKAAAAAARQQRALTRKDMLTFYAANGLPANEEEIKNWSNKVVNGADLNEFFTLKRKTDLVKMYPDWAEHLNAGMNVRDLAGSYISAMSQTLGLDPNEVTVSDPTLQRALHYTDANGNKGLRNLYDFKLDLRKDPRWATSEDGHNTIASYYDETLKMFGLKA